MRPSLLPSRLRQLAVTLCVLAALCTPAYADEPSAEIPLDRLKLELEPLQQEDLQKQAKLWIDALEASVRRGNAARLAYREATDPQEKQAKQTEVETLAEERQRYVARTAAVLDQLEAKGGDVTVQRKYVAAVGDVQAQLIETRGRFTVLWDWVKSPDGGLRILKQIGIFLLIILGFRIAAAVAGGAVRRSLGAVRRTPELLRNFLANTTRNVIMLIGLVVALAQFGIDVGPMMAAIGGAGFVIGFALQSTLSNFAAGVMILIYRPYEIGDIVTVGGTTGKVSAMTLVSTTVLTPDNQVVVVPNSTIWGDVITNATGSATRRVDMTFGIGYDDDMDKAQALLMEIASSHPKVLEEPGTVVKLGTLNASSVDYVVRPWCKTEDYWDVYWDVTRQVKERFDAEGISIPYPQTDIHIHQASPA